MNQSKIIYMAAGCFWGSEKAFQLVKGVLDTEVGYLNGHTENPTYEQVCSHTTGFKEAVRINYDPAQVRLETLLKVFFMCIHPEQKDGQGNDIGDQYLAGVYYEKVEDRTIIETYFEKEKVNHDAFYVTCEEAKVFYPAEEYHQDYLIKNPTGYCHIPFSIYEKIKELNHE